MTGTAGSDSSVTEGIPSSSAEHSDVKLMLQRHTVSQSTRGVKPNNPSNARRASMGQPGRGHDARHAHGSSTPPVCVHGPRVCSAHGCLPCTSRQLHCKQGSQVKTGNTLRESCCCFFFSLPYALDYLFSQGKVHQRILLQEALCSDPLKKKLDHCSAWTWGLPASTSSLYMCSVFCALIQN